MDIILACLEYPDYNVSLFVRLWAMVISFLRRKGMCKATELNGTELNCFFVRIVQTKRCGNLVYFIRVFYEVQRFQFSFIQNFSNSLLLLCTLLAQIDCGTVQISRIVLVTFYILFFTFLAVMFFMLLYTLIFSLCLVFSLFADVNDV